jgi:hypothetical protein
MYEKILQLLRSYREHSLTTQKFDRDRGKLIQKQRPPKSFSPVVFGFVDVLYSILLYSRLLIEYLDNI